MTYNNTKPGRQNDIIIYEFISFLHLPFIAWTLFGNKQIHFINISKHLLNFPFVRQAIASGCLIRISWSQIPKNTRFALDQQVLDIVDSIYMAGLGNSKQVQIMTAFFGSEMIHEAYKKAFAERVYQFFQMHLTLSYAVSDQKNTGNIYFIPFTYYSDISFLLSNTDTNCGMFHVNIPWWGSVLMNGHYLLQRIKWVVIFFLFPILIFLKIGLPGIKIEKKSDYSVGIRVYTSDWAFYKKYRRIDFLIDEKTISSSDCIFCIDSPISNDYVKQLKNKGYNYVDISKILQSAPFPFIFGTILKRVFPVWGRCLFFSFFENPVYVKLTLEGMLTYLLWNRFFEKYSLSDYVVYNETIPRHIFRNIVMKRQKTTTWFYCHSCHSIDFFTPEGCPSFMNVGLSYLSFDYMATWNKKMTNFYLNHPNKMGLFTEIGCLWSEHIQIASKNPDTNKTLSDVKAAFITKNNRVPQKILGVFDTSYGEVHPLDSRDMSLFIDDILHLLNDLPDIGVIYKMKKTIKEIIVEDPNIQQYLDRLASHPRCVLLDTVEYDPTETLAISYLVISMCFTSTTIESLAAHRRGIYHDAANRFRGCYYDRFSNLVSHNYDELFRLVNYWIDASDEDFNLYLEKWVRGEIDEYFDGKALSRFRDKLVVNYRHKKSREIT